jgi:hypothetical protein
MSSLMGFPVIVFSSFFHNTVPPLCSTVKQSIVSPGLCTHGGWERRARDKHSSAWAGVFVLVANTQHTYSKRLPLANVHVNREEVHEAMHDRQNDLPRHALNALLSVRAATIIQTNQC